MKIRLQEYIARFRAERAANLLKYSNESIANIGDYVGFPSLRFQIFLWLICRSHQQTSRHPQIFLSLILLYISAIVLLCKQGEV